MKEWTIGQVAAQAGVAASTIRYYEEIGLLPAAQRVNGQRRYEEEILQRLGIIRLAQQADFSTSASPKSNRCCMTLPRTRRPRSAGSGWRATSWQSWTSRCAVCRR
jgi:DNA-binding transcriptional MerR regulator